jgi:hypothetical protein
VNSDNKWKQYDKYFGPSSFDFNLNFAFATQITRQLAGRDRRGNAEFLSIVSLKYY